MNNRRKLDQELRHELDRSRNHDHDVSIENITSVANDAWEEGNEAKAIGVLSKIPPIKLGKTVYRVITGGKHGLMIVGPRGGVSHLVQSSDNPLAYAHNTVHGTQAWYLRGPDGTFTKI